MQRPVARPARRRVMLPVQVESIILKEMSSFYYNNAAALEDAHTHKKALRQRLTDALTSGISEQRETARALERKHAGKHAVARALPRRRHEDGAVLDMERERIFGWIADAIECTPSPSPSPSNLE